jgi:hypothetical protein
MFDPNLGRWMQEDPIGFDAGDVNLYRAESNSPTTSLDPTGLDDVRIERDRKGTTGGFLFELKGGKLSTALMNAEFESGGTKIKMSGYTGGNITLNTSATPSGSPLAAGVTIVAKTACSGDFHWMQLVKRDFKLRPGQKPPDGGMIGIKKGGIEYYSKPGEWRVDSNSGNSPFWDQANDPSIINGFTKDENFPLASAMSDMPGFSNRGELYSDQSFEALTYLMDGNKIIYTVNWTVSTSYVQTKGTNGGTWTKPKVTIVKGDKGTFGMPPGFDTDAKTWPWYYGNPTSKTPLPVANPLLPGK